MPPSPRLSKLAVVSLLLGVFGFGTILLLGIVPAVFALICGHVALIKIKHSQRPMGGKLAAYVGLLSGYATVLLTPLLAIAIAVAIPLINNAHQQSQERNRLDHASELFRACENFARDRNDRYPKSWDQLEGRYVSASDLKRLLKPQHATFWETAEEFAEEILSDEKKPDPDPAFLLVPHDRPVLRELEGSVIVIREVAPASVERVVVSYDNGQTTMIANPNRQ